MTESNESRGVVFLVTPAYLIRFVVAVTSLRLHYTGQVTVFFDSTLGEIAACIAADSRLGITYRLVPTMRDPQAFKPRLVQESPFRQTVYLDADVVVRAPIDTLFPLSESLVVTTIDEHHTTQDAPGLQAILRDWECRLAGNPRWGELAQLRGRLSAHPLPIVNTGVCAWRRGLGLASRWAALAAAGAACRCSSVDEIGLQFLLAGTDDWRLADPAFNTPASAQVPAGALIVHYVCGRHRGDHVWLAELAAAQAMDAGGITEWGSRFAI